MDQPTHPGDIVQVSDNTHASFPAILLVHEVRGAHVEGRAQGAAETEHPPVRMKPGQFAVVGAAHLLPPELAAARRMSIETAALVARESSPGSPAGEVKENVMPDYKVTVEGSDPIPVQASNMASARNHAVRQKVKVELLTTRDAIEFGKKGVDIQVAGEEPAEVASGSTEQQQEAGTEPDKSQKAKP